LGGPDAEKHGCSIPLLQKVPVMEISGRAVSMSFAGLGADDSRTDRVSRQEVSENFTPSLVTRKYERKKIRENNAM